jgi:hypothetical protein
MSYIETDTVCREFFLVSAQHEDDFDRVDAVIKVPD